MDIDLVFKIAAIGIIVAVLNQLLIRSGREDQAMMTTLAGLIWCIGYIGYNHFKGTEDPDWEVLEEQRRYRDSTSA